MKAKNSDLRSEHNLCTEFKMEDMKHINIEIVVSGVSFLFNSTCGLANFFMENTDGSSRKTQ